MTERKFFTQALAFGVGLSMLIFLLHLGLRQLQLQHWFIMHAYWPLSVFNLKLPRAFDLLTLLSISFWGYLLFSSWFTKRKLTTPILVIILVIGCLTNLLAGYYWGFVHPITGHDPYDFGYYQDAKLLHHVGDFIRNYELYQPTLGYHARVHPPGAVLLYFLIQRFSLPLGLAAVGLYALSFASVVVSYLWLRESYSRKDASLTAITLGLMPAMMIYGLAALDGLIAGLFIGTLWLYFSKRNFHWGWVSLVGLVASAFTFASIWLVITLFIAELWLLRSLDRWLKVIGGLVLMWWLLEFLTGYNYWNSFQIARQFEGFRGGFYALVQPVSYAVTRLQDVLEPIIFIGPVVGLALLQTYRQRPRNEITKIAITGGVAFLIFIIGGAYYTGETARAALYLLPLVMLPLAGWFKQQNLSNTGVVLFWGAVILQTTLMQLFGYYSW